MEQAEATARDDMSGPAMTERLREPAVVRPAEPVGGRPDWGPARRGLFRFLFAYLVLYNFPFPLQFVPWLGGLVSGVYQRAWQAVVPWVGANVLHLPYAITVLPAGSGDTTWSYVQQLCFVVLALIATGIWTVLDRRRLEYGTMQRWLRVYVRYVLGFTMMSYGGAKVIKSQFPFPRLSRLVESYGDSSPMGLLWTFMGYSTAYNVFTGLGELVGGALLFFRRLTTLGSLLVIAVLSNVVILNFAYDVPVKLYSLNLLFMAFFLLAPDAGRLWNVLVMNRAVMPADQRPLFRSRRLDRGALVASTLFLLFAGYTLLHRSWTLRHQYGDLAPTPPLYGLYYAEEFVRDGQVLPPLLTDSTRWRRVIFDRSGNVLITLMNDSTRYFRVTADTVAGMLALVPPRDTTARFTVEYARHEDRLVLTGAFEADSLVVTLRRRDESTMPLVARGFHWINETPYNR